ncbi:hypothetical protein RhiirC2_752551 [Rhizophagus irregularis]|uniref:Uncharacterized protein n=2 Tax=Rhizophagus irregularis TaxID=588596 RepID=A0A2N1MZA6_9GLOM|nr:hypothetical protein RhiirC2_752551 [Rhizophagus irregularis]
MYIINNLSYHNRSDPLLIKYKFYHNRCSPHNECYINNINLIIITYNIRYQCLTIKQLNRSNKYSKGIILLLLLLLTLFLLPLLIIILMYIITKLWQ